MGTTVEVSDDRKEVIATLSTVDGDTHYKMKIFGPGEAHYIGDAGEKVLIEFAIESYWSSIDDRKTWQYVPDGAVHVPVWARYLLNKKLREIRAEESTT